MKTSPILFSGSMVRAILDGSKTQTRRIIGVERMEFVGDKTILKWSDLTHGQQKKILSLRCKYGETGDRLWVRETYNPGLHPEKSVSEGYTGCVYRAYDQTARYSGGWTPSIHMPRRHSRITLEIDSVRVEPVCEITEADAIAEGFPKIDYGSFVRFPTNRFAETWDALNSKRGYSWDSNPWVWVISFSRVIP
jgi:hypothetical protein